MDVLTRELELGDDTPRFDVPPPVPSGPVTSPTAATLAVLSLGAGLVHAGYAPLHFSEAWSHGLFFAVVAWLQLALAYLLLTRPSRAVYALGVANIAVIGVWIMSRTVGVPIGPDPWTNEPVAFPDVLASGLETLIVIGCAALLLRRAAPAWSRWHLSGVLVVAVAVAGLTTLSLTPRYTDAHNHTAAGAVAVDGHDHGTAAATPAALTGNTPCEKTGPPASEGSITDAQGHAHRGPTEQIAIDQPSTVLLQQQQAVARTVVDRYPTVADALAAGYGQSTVYVPCIGAHYTNIGLVPSLDFANPSELLYDGTTPDAKIVGLSYLVLHPGGAPDGFAGPNDHWHQHNANGGLCFAASGLVIGAEDVTAADCAARGGLKQELPDIWMLHDWVVPGWECTWGSFAPECPELGGRIGASAWST